MHTQPPDTYSFTSECPPIFETILNGGIEEAKTAIRNLPNKDIQCPELLITPLHLACVTGKVPLVELLLDLGAKPMIRDSLDNTPLHLCAYFRRYHTARKFLLKIKDKEIAQKLVNLINHAGMSPLYVASATGDVRLMELFSKYGADINSYTKLLMCHFNLFPLYFIDARSRTEHRYMKQHCQEIRRLLTFCSKTVRI